jgi:hypothetical protein
MCFDGNAAEHLVERTPEIVEDRANRDVERCRDIRENITPDLYSIRVDVFDRFVQARWVRHGGSSGLVTGKFDRCEDIEIRGGFEKLVDFDLEIIDLGFGPFDLGETFQKRTRFHDIESVMAKDDDIQRTKALMGALVRMKPQPHEEMKVSNSKAKKPKSLAKKRASASSKPKNA